MLDFRKSLSHQLIENDYFYQEAQSQCCRSTRIQEGIGHGLMSFPTLQFFWVVEWCLLTQNTPPPPPKKCNFLQKRDADLLQMDSRHPYL